METLFWGHASSKDADLITLYFRITIHGLRAELGSTGIKINRKQWSGEAQRIVRSKTQKAQEQNQTLALWEARAWAIYNSLQAQNEPFTANYVKQLFAKENKGYSFIHLFDLYLNSIQSDPRITKGTRETYQNVGKQVSDWLTTTRKQADLLAVHFGKSFVEQYRTYMRVDLNRKESTIRKHTNTILQVLRFGYLNDYTNRNPLQGYRVPGVKYPDPVFLNKEELSELIAYQFEPEEHVLSEVKDIFLMHCFTGMAYADLKALHSNDIVTVQSGNQSIMWLEKERKKTDVKARQPIHPVVQGILDARYGGKPENMKMRANQKMNGYLKVIALRAGIAKKLTTHIGRKTFANLCLNGGLYAECFAPGSFFRDTVLSTEATIAMMGRTSSKGLEVYARPDQRRILAELNKAA